MNKSHIIIPAFVAAAAMIGCKSRVPENTSDDEIEAADSIPFLHEESNGIYYWKTVLDLDSADINFLSAHNVDKAYIRFFDVVPDKSPVADSAVIPNATLQVKDSIKPDNVVPTVYITLDAVKRMKGSEEWWADRIVTRVENMCSYNEFDTPYEIQLDCDWTDETEETYFALCRAVKGAIANLHPGAGVSSTIRLHQLSKTPPPVDYGVLMLYNTGSFKNIDSENSILSVADVKPYLKNLGSYPLHLDFAYPTYSWNLIYRDSKFFGIMRCDMSELGNSLRKLSGNKYIVKDDIIVNDVAFRKGDIIRNEKSDYVTIAEVKKLVDSHLAGKAHSNIIYHYESKNLSQYTGDEINSIYN